MIKSISDMPLYGANFFSYPLVVVVAHPDNATAAIRSINVLFIMNPQLLSPI
ncbi:hypothetical protein C8R21_1682 [Nitrosospira multiformis]|uniref:Uncharacterized protein n=1 Tax=Nitrosospira multiformis TaxID=1231 RepID=A0A2T5HY32_9PROT|nr:hypothetical protein C8R21_1682 [Nitrosospira multiformis]